MTIKEQENVDSIRLISKEQFETLYQISQTLNTAVFQDTLIEETLDLIIKVINA